MISRSSSRSTRAPRATPRPSSTCSRTSASICAPHRDDPPPSTATQELVPREPREADRRCVEALPQAFHLLAPDGVFAETDAGPAFTLLPVPTGGDLLAILEREMRRVARRLAREEPNDPTLGDSPPG